MQSALSTTFMRIIFSNKIKGFRVVGGWFEKILPLVCINFAMTCFREAIQKENHQNFFDFLN